MTTEVWALVFAAVVDGRPVGGQEMTGIEFPKVRTVSSFSWLGRDFQGQGLGQEMRGAMLHLAFAGLGALRARCPRDTTTMRCESRPPSAPCGRQNYASPVIVSVSRVWQSLHDK
ncbi:MAG TPA: GNAT family protein [Acidimicrobiales bacterium]|nr:GNAT family protein [Acidimicrobiales bacterium]